MTLAPPNKVIQRPHYPLPTLDDITLRLAGAQHFSVLDARSDYWAIKLSHESSMLTTFNTIYGRYRFMRLPFGIISAQDEFQRRVDEAYEGLQGVVTIPSWYMAAPRRSTMQTCVPCWRGVEREG